MLYSSLIKRINITYNNLYSMDLIYVIIINTESKKLRNG